jgi:hypothetical protein
MKRIVIVFVALALLLGGNQSVAGDSSPQDWDASAHYIIFEMDGEDLVTVQSHYLVTLSAPLVSLTSEEIETAFGAPNRNADLLGVRLLSATSETVFQNLVQVPVWLRGEFHGEELESQIEGHFFALDPKTFVVRVPVIPGATLQILNAIGEVLTAFDLDSLPVDALPALARSAAPISGDRSGPPGNRVDLLIMGDGYHASQQTQFMTDASTLHTNFFNITPLSDYAGYFNVTYLFTPSLESGADHPHLNPACPPGDLTCCTDPAMGMDPLAGTFKNTAFDARYCAQNIHRLLVVDVGKVFAAAAVMPDWDTILVMVNDTTYGGSGGALATVSTHSLAVDIAQHEFGHTFGLLADEYDTAYPGYPACSDISGGSPCEDNVTDETVRAQIKWAPWILPTTPVPTVPEWDPGYAAHVGLFQGARYQPTTMYRSGQLCLMQSLGQPLCQVPSQSIVLRLYQGGWGVPWSGINMIEPGLIQPPVSSVSLGTGEQMVFHAVLLYPKVPPLPRMDWFVDGVPVLNGSQTFTYTPGRSDVGSHTVSLVVMDLSPHVHPAMTGGALTFQQQWTVQVTVPNYLPFVTH